MNKFKLVILLLCLVSSNVSFADGTSMTRAELATYASSLRGLKKADLKTAVYKLCQPTKVLSYGSGAGATWSGFVKTDRIGTTLECRNRYSEDRFYFTSATSTKAIDGMNIEHSFPKSWWGGSTNNAYRDLFNLYPSASDANSSKSNYPMGKVTDASILDDYEKVGKGTAGSLGSIQLCEPNDEWKGDFCRSYFYMATIYQNLTWQGTQGLQELENDTWPTLREWAYTLYLEWTRTDRVTDIEVDRNNAVYDIQGNRNLFIDFPELAEYVWGDSVNVAFNPNTSLTSAADDSRFATYQEGNYEQGQSGEGELTQVAQAPTLTPGGSFATDEYYVKITNNEDGATVYYTTDGTTPTTSSTSFTGESTTLTINATTTVKAMAVVDGKDNSNVTTATYTKTSSSSIANTPETAYTVADANVLISAGNDLDQWVYVKGIISQIDSYNSTYGEITYYISDDGTTDDQFEIYGGLDLDSVKFTSVDDIEVGAHVIVYGRLKSYYGTYEMNFGNYLVKYVAPGEEDPAETEAVTFDFTNPILIGIEKPEASAATNLGTDSYTKDRITLTATDGSTATRIWNSQGTCTLRVYANGGTITFTAPEGYVITGVTFTYAKNSFSTVDPGTLSDDGTTWTGSSNSVTFTASNTVQVNTATITYAKDPTGIKPVYDNDDVNDDLYNIAGQRVGENYKGIVIKNGRKFIQR